MHLLSKRKRRKTQDCLLVHEGEAVGAKDVENDAGVSRVALTGGGLLDEAGENSRRIAAKINSKPISIKS